MRQRVEGEEAPGERRVGQRRIAMAGDEEIELGEELVEVERRSPAGAVLSIRLSQDELRELQRIAKRRGLTVAEFARAALAGVAHSGGAGVG